MGGIWKPPGRKKWRLWWRDPVTGKKRTATGYTDKGATAAKLVREEKNAARRAEGLPVVEEDAPGKDLDALVTRYIKDVQREGAGKDHLSCEEGFLRRLAGWEGWKTLRDVRHDSCSKALASLDEKGYAPASVNHYRSAWRRFAAWCVDNHLLPENVLSRVKRSGGQEEPRKRRAPTLEEWLALVSGSPEYRSNLYLVAGLTGLRKKELRLLERRDVDLESKRLKLRAEATKGKRADVVPLLPDVFDTLAKTCEGLTPTERVFSRMPGKDTIARDIARAGIESPGPDGRLVTFHSMRYFFCTLLAKKLPIQVVKILMRHKNISLTCKVYLDLGLEDVTEAMLQIPSVLGCAPAHPGRSEESAT